jgi:hypothetical protein
MHSKQILVTVPAGKRLIAKAVTILPQIKQSLKENTVVIIAGTTNGFVGEEILQSIDQLDDFTKDSFYRGATVAPGRKLEPDKDGYFNKDIVIEKGKWIKDKTIYDVGSTLSHGDIIIKGANAIAPDRKTAGIQIGNPSLGSSGPIMQAVIGKRTELILPVGLEKRVMSDIGQIAAKLNSPTTEGVRMLPVSGTIVTEIEAIELLSGAVAELIAAGGVLGAEGSSLLLVTGSEEQLETISSIMKNISKEPSFGKQ